MNTKTKITAIVSTILLTSALAGPAKADTSTTPLLDKVPTDTSQLATIKAEATSVVTFTKTEVTTTPAVEAVEAVEAPVAVQTSNVEAKPTAPEKAAPVAAQAAPVAAPARVKAAAPAAAPASGRGATIAAAAYAQIGVAQDCTALVTNALAAAGINFHGWPAEYAALGSRVSSPQPGDILIYANAGAGVPHVAIYVGNGQAIHGGFNGSTVLFSANVGSGYSAIRVA